MNILVVEDDKKIAEAIAEGLRAEHFAVSIASSGEDGFFRLGQTVYDLIILDVMLPGRDGFEVLETLRNRGDVTPALMLTAKDSVEDRVKGLNLGADDYLTKPFEFAELLARVQALLRRRSSSQQIRLKVNDLEIDLLTRRVSRAGVDIYLTAKEYELLEYFMRRPLQIVSREMLANDVWEESAKSTSINNVIDVHIARLRKKLSQDNESKLLRTVRGAGFILQVGQ